MEDGLARQPIAVVVNRRLLAGHEDGMAEGKADRLEDELGEHDLLVAEATGKHAGHRSARIAGDYLRRQSLQQDQRVVLILKGEIRFVFWDDAVTLDQCCTVQHSVHRVNFLNFSMDGQESAAGSCRTG
jgi:hypothetical protein